MARPDVLIVSAEPSGDQLGASLAKSLRARNAEIRIAAIGGPKMEAEGYPSLMPVEGLAVLGFVEGLKAYPLVLSKVREASRLIRDADPKAVVLIDSWGFMVRTAKALRKRSYSGKIIKYVAPQVWATRPGRAKILARHVDHLLSTQTMDRPYFKAAGLPMTFVGNPVLDRDYGIQGRDVLREKLDVSQDTLIVGLLPGSRASEIERLGAGFLKAKDQVAARSNKVRFVTVASGNVRAAVENLFEGEGVALLPESEMETVLSGVDVALACSGTVTTQLAAAGVPTAVLYRLSPLTYAVASRIFQQDYISLVNLSAGRALMPEFLQEATLSDDVPNPLMSWLGSPEERQRLSSALKRETRRMGAGSGSASDRAAEAILEMIALSEAA